MLVKIIMKNKQLYKGLKCGSEGGFLYLINPVVLSEDEEGEMDGYWESNIGESIRWTTNNEVRFILVPISDIELMTSLEI